MPDSTALLADEGGHAEDHTYLPVSDGHGHAHGGHGHAHGHGEPIKTAAEADDAAIARKKLTLAIVFCLAFMVAEIVGGVLSHSLAILTDAAHLFSDVGGLAISLISVRIASRPATASKTFGFHRVEVIGALASIMVIWVLTGVLVYLAVDRVMHPDVVDGKIMFIISILGLAVNLSMMKILHQGGHGHSHGGHGHSHGGHGHGAAAASCDDAAAAPKKETNIAVRSAFIHVLGDLLQSVATMIAAIIIWYGNAHGKDWSIADPICTFVFSVLVVFTTVNVVKSALAQLLNSVPSHMSLATIARELVAIPGVANVHDLHVWGFGQNRVALTVHLIADEPAAALVAAQRVAAKHGIAHSTIQTEQCGSRDLANCISYNEHAGACAISLSAAPGGGGGGHGHGGHGHGGGHGHSHGGGHGHSHGGHGHFTAPAPHPHYSGGHSHSSSSCGGSGSSSSSSLDVISRPLPSDVHASGCGAVLSPASPGGGVPAQVPATPAGAVLLPSSPGPTPVLPLSPLGSPAGTVVGSAPAFARLARQDSGGDGDEADLLGLGLGASTL